MNNNIKSNKNKGKKNRKKKKTLIEKRNKNSTIKID